MDLEVFGSVAAELITPMPVVINIIDFFIEVLIDVVGHFQLFTNDHFLRWWDATLRLQVLLDKPIYIYILL